MLPKFRIWDKEEKHMKTFPSSVGHLVGAILTEQMRGESNSVVKPNYSKYVVMMGTGLKDKNGKEIYEGDIVKIRVNKKWWFGVVKWSEKNGWWAIDYLPTNMEGEDYDCILSEEILSMKGENRCEIIGNIFENPELLKEVKK